MVLLSPSLFGVFVPSFISMLRVRKVVMVVRILSVSSKLVISVSPIVEVLIISVWCDIDLSLGIGTLSRRSLDGFEVMVANSLTFVCLRV